MDKSVINQKIRGEASDFRQEVIHRKTVFLIILGVFSV